MRHPKIEHRKSSPKIKQQRVQIHTGGLKLSKAFPKLGSEIENYFFTTHRRKAE
jgi:hypothetical protein